MTHVRTQIRAWLKTNLAGSADAGNRVFIRRSLPLEKDMQPTLIVAFHNERSTDITTDGTQERAPEIRITACAKGDAETTEDVLDRLGLFVEHTLAANPTFGGLVSTYEYQSTEFAFASDGDRTFCTAAFTFTAAYFTNRGDAENSL